jgi:hypothetical protein
VPEHNPNGTLGELGHGSRRPTMRKLFLIGAIVAAPVKLAFSGALACYGYEYGYGPR